MNNVLLSIISSISIINIIIIVLISFITGYLDAHYFRNLFVQPIFVDTDFHHIGL